MGELKDNITSDFLNEINSISFLISNNINNTAMSGNRKSKAKGNSLEFSDFRDYILGDDIRRIDWNSYARFDKLFIKVFEEEKQADVNIFIDISSSMSEQFEKSIFSRKIALAIIYIILKNTDRVNIFTFSDDIVSKKLKLYSSSKFYDAIDFLDNVEVSGSTIIKKSLTKGFFDIKNKGLSYIISDFFFEDNYKEALKFLLYKKQKVCCIQTLSKFDEEPDSYGVYGNVNLIDSESEDNNIYVNLTPLVIDEYKKNFLEFKNDINSFCKKMGIKFISVNTKEPISKIILNSL